MKHSETSVLRALSKKHDVLIESFKIFVLNESANKKYDLGNGSWGKIDFLMNCCGYNLFFTNSF